MANTSDQILTSIPADRLAGRTLSSKLYDSLNVEDFREPNDTDRAVWAKAITAMQAQKKPLVAGDRIYNFGDDMVNIVGIGYWNVDFGNCAIVNTSTLYPYINGPTAVDTSIPTPTYAGPMRGCAFYFTTLTYYGQFNNGLFFGFRFVFAFLEPWNSPLFNACNFQNCNAGVFAYLSNQNFSFRDCVASGSTQGPLFISSATCFPVGTPYIGTDNFFSDGMHFWNQYGSLSPSGILNHNFDDWFVGSIMQPTVPSDSDTGAAYVYPDGGTTSASFVIPAVNGSVAITANGANYPVGLLLWVCDYAGNSINGQITASGSGTVTITVKTIIAGIVGNTMASGAITTLDTCRPSGWSINFTPYRNQRVCFGPTYIGMDLRLGSQTGAALINTSVEALCIENFYQEVHSSPIKYFFKLGSAVNGIVTNFNFVAGDPALPFIYWTGLGFSSGSSEYDNKLAFVNYNPFSSSNKSTTFVPNILTNNFVQANKHIIGSDFNQFSGLDARPDSPFITSMAVQSQGSYLQTGEVKDGLEYIIALPALASDGSWHRNVRLDTAGYDVAGVVGISAINTNTGEHEYGEYYVQTGATYNLTTAADLNNGDAFIAVTTTPTAFLRYSQFLAGGIRVSADYFDNATKRIYLLCPMNGLASTLVSGSTISKPAQSIATIKKPERGFFVFGFGVAVNTGATQLALQSTVGAYAANTGAISPSTQGCVYQITFRSAEMPAPKYSAGAPAAGTWAYGAIVLENAPVANGPVGYVNLAAGTPGTFGAFGGLTVPTNVQVFTSSGTWTKTAGTVGALVYVVGGGGGGGGGPVLAASTAGSGGAGGGGGARASAFFGASALPGTATVTVGAGGTAGVGASSAGAGTAGGVGGTSSFISTLNIFAPGGGGGAGGTAGIASGGGGAGGFIGAGTSGSGATAGVSNGGGGAGGGPGGSGTGGGTGTAPTTGGGGAGSPAAGAAGTNGGASFDSATGGGAGAGISAANAVFSGGASGTFAGLVGAAGGTTGNPGTAGSASNAISFPGTGGGGGGSAVGAAGAGGNGANGGGAGGGGASQTTGGNGGVGGGGFVVVIEYF